MIKLDLWFNQVISLRTVYRPPPPSPKKTNPHYIVSYISAKTGGGVGLNLHNDETINLTNKCDANISRLSVIDLLL